MAKRNGGNGKGREEARELLDRLHSEVEAIVSGDDWRRALDLSRRLHSYSFGNLLLIASQRPDATMVAGYRRWQSLGRQVRKGERSIRILAPLRVKKEDEETGDERRVLVGFRAAGVFDVGQTDGEPLPEPPTPTLLDGTAPEGALAGVVAMIEAEGFSFERGSCAGIGAEQANGWTNHKTRTVRVRADVSDAQALETAVHELAHVVLHDPNGGGRVDCRGTIEVEAESVAYVVAGAIGLPTDDYSFPYVAGWSGGDVEAVRATGTRVLATAERIVERLSEPASEEVRS